ncbi:unnamed protein product [Orchesella dallaii]|uniref:RNA-directed DNA polymerase n=1 Tax=Orchesella dallaii TaxID=48710 RepID=A0ABP1RLS4_9HEXA
MPDDLSDAESAKEKVSAVRSHVPTPQALKLNSGNVSENWKKFSKAYEFYEIASGFEQRRDKVRVAALLSIIGVEATDLYSTFVWDRPDDQWIYSKVTEQFEKYCNPRKRVLYETYRFGIRKQEAGEGLDTYVTALRKLADNCAFPDKERSIRDQVVLGLRDSKLREIILRVDDPTLTEVTQHGRAYEQAILQNKEITPPDELEQVSEVKKGKGKKNHQNRPAQKTTGEAEVKINCKFCGNKHERNKNKCPAYKQKCSSCGKQNHFAKCCKSTNNVETQEMFCLYSLSNPNMTKKTITLTLPDTNQKLKFLIDTGASCNVLPVRDYIRVTGDKKKKNITPRKVTVVTYGGKQWTSLGDCWLNVKLNNRNFKMKCLVVDIDASPLLSLQSCEFMDIVKIISYDREKSTEENVNVVTQDSIMKQYEDVFNGLGKLEGQYHITLNEEVKPVVHAPRSVPVSLREPVKAKLEELEKQGVISRVTEPTDWVSSMLVKKETNKLRICLDPQDLNKAIKREHYPLPTMEDVATRLGKVKVFSLLDAKNGFWQIELDERSSYLTTFNTPFGRYRWCRMPFGISSAPEVWQRRMHELAEGLKGVEVIADDFLIVGCGDEQDEANRDHDRNLIALLERARQKNLKLNAKKMRIKLTELQYMGHVLTPNGVKMDPRKMEAILKMPKPTDKKAVQRLLGMVQYLAKFLPRLSDTAEPLRRLTDDSVDWDWKAEHEDSFQKLRKLATAAPVLAYYDMKKSVTIQCDASEKGLGAVLLQEGKPVVFASRALTQTEQRYAQIEKEMLAIVYACTRFDQYVYGRKVEVHSDHKPLEAIFKKMIWKSPKRLQRMLLALQRYNLDVKFKKGTEMYIADALSRAFLPRTEENISAVEVAEASLSREFENINSTEDSPNTAKGFDEIRKAVKEDNSIEKLRRYILEGWPEKKNEADPECQPYFHVRDELTEENYLIFRGERVVIPLKLRRGMMKKAHSSHCGIESCLRRAREHVYWPSMDSQLKDYIGSCELCNTFRSQQQKEPMMSHEVPNRPWSTVSTDIFELKSSKYVIVVDHYSNYFEYARLNRQSTAEVVKELKKIFASHGIPDKMISDNGPQYSSEEFRKFVEEWQIEHVTSSPGYPQSNGRAENAVKTCKNLMIKSIEGKTDFFMALLDWRNTPSTSMGMSPVQRLCSRRTRTLMPTQTAKLTPEVQSGVKEKIEKAREQQKTFFDRSARPLPALKQGDVVRMKLPNQKKWSKGIVLKEEGKRQYSVKVNGGVYRRNRRQLVAVTEDPPDRVRGELHEDQQAK